MKNLIRPYQQEVILAVLDSVFHKNGLTFTVEIARQGGKNIRPDRTPAPHWFV